jgi:single-strand DNA-binding protein
MDLNKVMLIGRLTADPEVRTTPQGITVASFSVATNRVWKDQQGNQQDRTEFHNIVTWRRLAEICAQYLTKGKQVYLEGHLQTRSWAGQDGKKNYRTEIVADNMIMLGNRSDSGSAPAPRAASTPAAVTASSNAAPVEEAAPASVTDEEIRIEDIPF